MRKDYCVYILTNRSGQLYVGVTGDIARRVAEHRSGSVPGYTSRYGIKHLVFAERFHEVTDALAREKQLKGWSRAKKVALIEASNPDWVDLGFEDEADATAVDVRARGAIEADPGLLKKLREGSER